MKNFLFRWFAGVILFGALSLNAQALTGMIYQPQLRDMKVPDSFWATKFSDLRQRGFDTLIIQWTRYGDAFSTGVEKNWLTARLQDAAKADLKLIIGLYADPDSFASLDMPTDLLETYFLKMHETHLQLARDWTKTLPAQSIIGWYLPTEIDDRRWRDNRDLTVLNKQLARDVTGLNSLGDLPVYITAFFKGHTEANEYKAMLSVIQRSTALRIWVQDGVGTRSLLPTETSLYINKLTECSDTPIAGLVFEIFRQVGPDSNFKAEPLTGRTLEKALSQRSPCRGDSVFFSLRYLFNFGN